MRKRNVSLPSARVGTQEFGVTALQIEQIPVLRDNYVYLVFEPQDGVCAAVDPAVAAPVLDRLAERGWTLTHILNTHHHQDHVGGNLDLKRATGCTVIGNRQDADRIPGLDVAVEDGDDVAVGQAAARVLDVSGHTRGHIAYWFEEDGALFCGDTLFSLGCGRLFEGTPAEMWRSLQRLRMLPEQTRVYCAHEYTESNARFAVSVDPQNADLLRRAEEVQSLRNQGRPTIPSSIGLERATNPFLRADLPGLRQAAGIEATDPVAVFADLRRRKDIF